MIGVSLSGDVSLSQFNRTFAVGSPVDVQVEFVSDPPPTPPPAANRCVSPPDRWPYSLLSIGFSSALESAGTTSRASTKPAKISGKRLRAILSLPRFACPPAVDCRCSI